MANIKIHPSYLKRIITQKGFTKKFIREKIGLTSANDDVYFSHALNSKSSRYNTPKITKIREQIYQYLKGLN